MTDKGISLTLKGENLLTSFQPANHRIQILLWRQVGQLYRQMFDLSYAVLQQESQETELPDSNMLAYLVFSFEHETSEHDEDKDDLLFPGFKAYQHNIVLFHDHNIYTEWRKGYCKKLICISLDAHFILKCLPRNHYAFKHFYNALYNGEPAMLSPQHMALSRDMIALLDAVLMCKYNGYFKKSYLEAKVIELLILQFEQFEASVCINTHKPTDALDIDKMNRVRDILTNDLTASLSLRNLAQSVGTNEFYLKKNFKKQFGNTVFGYLHQFKMELSKKMLLNREMKISQVAENLGYKHATHFTTAFKKYFGYLPNKLKIMLLLMAGYAEELICTIEFL